MVFMVTSQNSCLRFPCFTHFALCTALSRSRNRHVDNAYAMFVFHLECKSSDDAWIALSGDSRRGRKIQGVSLDFVQCKMSLFVWAYFGLTGHRRQRIQTHRTSPRVPATTSSQVAMATSAPRAPSHPNAPFAVLDRSTNSLLTLYISAKGDVATFFKNKE